MRPYGSFQNRSLLMDSAEQTQLGPIAPTLSLPFFHLQGAQPLSAPLPIDRIGTAPYHQMTQGKIQR